MWQFSGRGETPHRRYVDLVHEPASGLFVFLTGVSRSGEMPEPTVTVRMKESVKESTVHLRGGLYSCFP